MDNSQRLTALENALIQADKAGNVDDAKILAQEIVRLRSAKSDAQSVKARPKKQNVNPQNKYQAMGDYLRSNKEAFTQNPAKVFQEHANQRRDALTDFVTNIPSSTQQVASDFAGLFSSKGLENAGKFFEGITEYLNPAYLFSEEPRPNQETVKAVGEAIANRWGSPTKAMNTLASDPVGGMFDISGAMSLAGPTKVGMLGRAIDPVNVVTNPIKAVAGAIPRRTATSLYDSALKLPPTYIRNPKSRAAALEAGLDAGVMPTLKGFEKVNQILNGLDVKIDSLINAADKAGKTASRKVIYQDLKALRQELSLGAAAPKHLKAVNKAVKELDELLKAGPDQWTARRLQQFKTRTYNDINWKKEKKPAVSETYRAMARGARKKLDDMSPELKAVNKEYGPLADLREHLPQIVNRVENRNIFDISTPLYATAGGLVGGTPGALLAGGSALINNPKIAAGLAIRLRELQNAGLFGNMMSNNPSGVLARQALLQSGRLEDLE